MANKYNCPCLASAGDEETIFTLKASDLDAPDTVEFWALLRETRQGGTSAKTVEARQIAARMREERAEMVNRIPFVPQPRMSPETKPRQFPIIKHHLRGDLQERCPASIPWLSIAPYEDQAKRNHGGQDLEKLARRSGLSPQEAYAVMHNLPFYKDPKHLHVPQANEAQAVAFLVQIVNGPTGGAHFAGVEERATAHGGRVFVDKRVVFPIQARPNKDWNACPYASHSDDCTCRAEGGDR